MKKTTKFLILILAMVTSAIALMSCGCTDSGIYPEHEHIAKDPTIEYIVSPTCTTGGSYYETIYCKICNELISQTEKTAEALGHNFGSYVSDGNATCTKDGTKTRTCQNEGCNLSETKNDINSAYGHPTTYIIYTGEYCLDTPVATLQCNKCNEIITTYGHDMVKYVSQPTCTNNGIIGYQCSYCDYEYYETLNARGHIASSWVVHKTPTCSEEGFCTKYCLVCQKDISNKFIERIAHSYSGAIVDGKMVYTCADCSHSYSEEIETPTYNITFDEQGGTEVADITVLSGDSPMLPIPEREGYVFEGWSDGSNIYHGESVFEDLNLYAIWHEIEIITDDDNIVREAPLNFTFKIKSDIALSPDRINDYVKITNLGGESITARVVSSDDGVYEIGADYEKQTNYFVELIDATFLDRECDELWIITNGYRNNELNLKSGVVGISSDQVFGAYIIHDGIVLVTYEDILNVDDHAVIYDENKNTYLFGIKIKEKATSNGFTHYLADMLEISDVFATLDISESEQVSFNNAELNDTLDDEIAAQFSSSELYAQFTSAVRAVAADYGSNITETDFDISFSTNRDSFVILLSVTADTDSSLSFHMNYYINLQFEIDFAMQKENSTLILLTDMVNTAELYISFDDNEVSVPLTTSQAELVNKFRTVFNEINERNLKINPASERSQVNKKSYDLATIPMWVGPAAVNINLTAEFDFAMMGGLSAQLVHSVRTEVGFKNGEFVSDYTAELLSIHGCVYAGVNVYGGIGVSVDAGFCGFHGYIKGSIGLRGELLGAGVMAISGNNSYALGTYNFDSEVVIDVMVGAKYHLSLFGFEKTIFDKSYLLYETGVPFITLGDTAVYLHFINDDYSTKDNALNLGEVKCGPDSNISLDDRIDTSVLVLKIDPFSPSTSEVRCGYYVNVVSGNVKASVQNSDALIIIGEGDFLLEITVKYENLIEKTVYIKGTVNHVYEDMTTNKDTLRTEASCINKTTYYYSCSSCQHISTDKYFEYGEKLPHTLGEYIRNTTEHWQECTYIGCDYATDKVEHEGTIATCIALSVCSTCNLEFGSYADHDFSGMEITEKYLKADATCDTPATYHYHCTVCKVSDTNTFEHGSANPHEYESNKTCIDRQCINCEHVEPASTEHIETDDGICECGTVIRTPGLVLTLNGDTYSITDYTGTYTEIIIPETYDGKPVTSIDSYAFSGCQNITSITIPISITNIGYHAFYNCSSLTAVYITDVEKWCQIYFNDYTANPIYYAHNLYLNDKLVTELSIPETVTSISSYAFAGCTSITNISFANSDITLGNNAFYNCTSLQYNVYDNAKYLGNNNNPYLYLWQALDTEITSVNIHPDTTRIYDSAFYKCANLTEVTIPAGVKTIGNSAFSSCTSLTSITIPDDISMIGGNAFNGCTSLSELTLPSTDISIGGYAFANCTGLTSIVIPEGVTEIGYNCFEKCTSLRSVTFPSTLVTIGRSAFYNCTNLGNITFPDSVKTIGDWSFYKCKGITNLVIGNGVTSIGSGAFYACSNLKNVTIPVSVKYIGSEAFYECSNVSRYSYRGTYNQWKQIDLGSNWNWGLSWVYCTDKIFTD